MNWIAACREDREITDRVKDKCSVEYDSGVEGMACVPRFLGAGDREDRAASVEGSHSRRTFNSSRALATDGHTVLTSDVWTISVSTELQADG